LVAFPLNCHICEKCVGLGTNSKHALVSFSLFVDLNGSTYPSL